MKIWADADGLPAVIREILVRAAERTGTPLVLVANRPLKLARSRVVSALQVQSGFDVADNAIVQRAGAGDLVVTSDIPLAAEVIDKGAEVLTPRGERLTSDGIRARLTMRDFMETLRASGIQSAGPPPLGQAERKAFADHLDRMLARGAGGARP